MAFVHRRPHRRDPSRDVLGSVSLIREINPKSPHRAHLDILAELSLNERLMWMDTRDKVRNFDGLLAAWLDALDTEELNRRFYRQLFAWFQRAVKTATFPDDEAVTLSAEEHIIRLITRLLFIWFIKEKGLLAEDLFVENRVRELLKHYDPESGDSYYRAVLQNLFFATLNTEIARRSFSNQSTVTHRNFSRYRYANEISDSDKLLALFGQTPFINGGLFDCLDSEETTGAGSYRIDCFTDNPAHRRDYSIPNTLFFDQDDNDPGLITLFNHYKFTVEENTPAEQEVALDPELLGKVFENLLAAYNPETKENVRKQTGSYYTPRMVVDYMVDEALVATLTGKTCPNDGDRQWWEERLSYLLDYGDAFNDADELFTPKERQAVILAIAGLRVLDPAVGSGAFPMGVLHKLTLALRRLDSDNSYWEALQKEIAGQRAEAAFGTSNRQDRDKELAEISETFEHYRDSDFGRKLYLIQNSIYGVDIQPVATQIAKLRFFISLAIEQRHPTNNPGENYGIRPLPNLETCFVAADTLLGLSTPVQLTLGRTETVKQLQQSLNANRERHFHANSRQQKLDCRRKDAQLRQELADALSDSGFQAADATKLSAWDPYDQNTSAEWFDPAYMFGVDDGFDIVIGNPPYVQLQKNSGRLRRLYRTCGLATFASTGDIYQLFYERGCQLLAQQQSTLAYITSNSWLKAEYGKALRRYFAENHTPLSLLELGKDVFDSVIVDASILLLRAGRSADTPSSFAAVDTDRLHDKEFPPARELWGQVRLEGDAPWSILSTLEQSVLAKMRAKGTPLKDWDIAINYGIKTGYNEAFIIDNRTKDVLIAEDPRSAEIIKPVVRGRDIRRYRVDWKDLWLIATFPALGLGIDEYPAVKKYLLSFGKDRLEQSGKRLPHGASSRKKTGYAWFELQDTCAYHADFIEEKLFWIDLTEQGRFAYDRGEMFCLNSAYMLTGNSLRYLCAVLNSALVTWFMQNSALNSGMGTTRWVRFTVDRIPIPIIDAIREQPFIQLVDKILHAHDAGADTTELEAEIEQLVYGLYELTEDEAQVIASKLGVEAFITPMQQRIAKPNTIRS